MRPRHVLCGLAALVATGCASNAAAEPQATTAPTVPLIELDALDALTVDDVPGTSAVPTTTAAVSAVPTHVAVVGDSLTVSSQELIEAALREAGVRTVTIDAVEGRRINHAANGKTSGVAATRAIAAVARPDVWVIALGTNDVPGFGPDSYRADVEALLAEIPAGDPVVWVDAWIKSRIDETRAANAVLREVAAGRPGTTVIDWFQFGDDPGVISGDGIHLTDQGEQRFAAQIATAILTP